VARPLNLSAEERVAHDMELNRLRQARSRARHNGTPRNGTEPHKKEARNVTPLSSTRAQTPRSPRREVTPSSPKKERGYGGNEKVAAMVDALRAVGVTPTITGRDARAIKETAHDPEEVAALYAAISGGRYGDAFMLRKLSVALCLESLPGWRAHVAGHRAPAAGSTSAVGRVLSVYGQDAAREERYAGSD
jgi:hypothetical protein